MLGSARMFGTDYQHIRWLTIDGRVEETWIPIDGFCINSQAHKLPTFNDAFVDPELVEISSSCNTSKEKQVRRKKIAGINVVSFPYGTILSVEELYGSESLSQVLLPVHQLMKIESIRNNVRVLIHDNACKFAAFVQRRRDTSDTLKHLANLDMRVDRHHFKNHVGKKCKEYHDPNDCELLVDVNTSIMEQVNNFCFETK